MGRLSGLIAQRAIPVSGGGPFALPGGRRGGIKDGTYPSGSKVPSVVQIADEFGVVNSTAQRAMEAVKAEGLTRAEKGMGTYVL
ncbi:GntR family transcriptional regulator [Streptomyces sp. NPDC005134]|uniref:GntR family transcriptional regulator n=1 Tax=Streptomyces sp. NPDC005096 TaxID=3154559 RepID=UPI0033A754D2